MVLTVIVLSSLTLVVETYKTDYWSDTANKILSTTDYIFNGLFIIGLRKIKCHHLREMVSEGAKVRNGSSFFRFLALELKLPIEI